MPAEARWRECSTGGTPQFDRRRLRARRRVGRPVGLHEVVASKGVRACKGPQRLYPSALRRSDGPLAALIGRGTSSLPATDRGVVAGGCAGRNLGGAGHPPTSARLPASPQRVDQSATLPPGWHACRTHAAAVAPRQPPADRLRALGDSEVPPPPPCIGVRVLVGANSRGGGGGIHFFGVCGV